MYLSHRLRMSQCDGPSVYRVSQRASWSVGSCPARVLGTPLERSPFPSRSGFQGSKNYYKRSRRERHRYRNSSCVCVLNFLSGSGCCCFGRARMLFCVPRPGRKFLNPRLSPCSLRSPQLRDSPHAKNPPGSKGRRWVYHGLDAHRRRTPA